MDSKRWRPGIRRLTAIALSLTGLSCFSISTAPVVSQPGTTTTIVIVRHTERDPGLDPPLNAVGLERAQALKETLAEQGVTAIFTTDLIRNRESVQPLADELGLELNLISPLEFINPAGLADRLVNDWITLHAGGTVLLCGNRGQPLDGQDLIGINEAVYRRLGGTGRAPEKYEDLYICVIPEAGSTRFIKASYGGPSPQD